MRRIRALSPHMAASSPSTSRAAAARANRGRKTGAGGSVSQQFDDRRELLGEHRVYRYVGHAGAVAAAEQGVGHLPRGAAQRGDRADAEQFLWIGAEPGRGVRGHVLADEGDVDVEFEAVEARAGDLAQLVDLGVEVVVRAERR